MRLTNKIVVLVLLIIVSSFCFSQILVSTEVDKRTFYENEVGTLRIKIANDLPEDVENITLRLEGSDGIRFVTNFEEQQIMIQETGEIRSGGSKEIYVKMKVISLVDSQPKIFVYYGNTDVLQNVSGTYVEAVQSPVIVKTNAQRINSEEGEKIIVDFSLVNYSQNELKEVIAEVVAPENYIIRTPPLTATNVSDKNSVEETFELIPPPEASGMQKIVLSYGYIDEAGAHYFEENFEVNIERTNQLILAVIGIVILVVAGYLYILKSKDNDSGLKGTGEKAIEGTQKSTDVK